ncbi:hypothetical protein BGZ61DRAFT_351649 [Ilyonectria robusta]|uniref:uncharacterized protein n=1 Tax=Ilyonectria robusta TaxID=1079257 RepID=UPI001E8D3058|nr:uncharacterized protein BGZ61DRAFT_351649 [Ilyonectria robusta]KAH8699880.1 hypothetical protein BGZ61DRAFT_351649 [Ilyonectria robusta]
MSSKHPLRRSCAFCRARKIKCSNETICEACRRQGADCIYDFEPSRPKTRNLSQDSTKSTLSVFRNGDAPVGHTRQRSISVGSPNSTPPSTVMEEVGPQGDVGESVAMALEQRFFENFSQDADGPRSSPWQERIAAYHRTLQTSLRDRPEIAATKFSPKNVRYTGILSLLTHDLVGLVTDQFGSLGCHHVEEGGARFFLSGLASDDTQTMFDNPPLGSNPLSEYGQRQQTQLIDVWYSVHPLSFLVSKTLLLRELRDGTHDEILLATMLADANFSIGDEVSIARGHVLLRWAISQLHSRPLRPTQSSSTGGGMSSGISTRIYSGISTAQALMLLAWNALCSFQLRRAICYIGLAGRMASEIKDQISNTSAPMTSSRINGIDVFDVEKEIIAYLYWTTYSLSLWAFIQMGNGHFSALLPTSLSSIFLPVTEASSVMIQLDLVSENFSTLQKQKSVIREMWPLAHIASVVAYIFALYPQDSDPSESPTTGFWQEAPLLALQRIQQGKPSKDIGSVCREINRVLMESIHILNRQVTEASSRSLVLVVYHAMAIHFLFPEPQPMQLEEPVTGDIVERFCSSSEDILQLFGSISDQPQDLFGLTPSLRGSFPDVFCMSLDTCARALKSIHARFNPSDASLIQVYEGRLQMLTRRLYDMSQNDFLNQGASIRPVRKNLKTCVRMFCSSATNSSGAPSPDNARMASIPDSPRRSPRGFPASDPGRLSAIPRIAIDSASPYGCVGDTSTMPSSMPSSSRSSSGASTNSYTPFEDVSKPEWQPSDALFHDVLDVNSLGTAPAEHMSIADLVDFQNSWCPQMPTMMDFDMGGPIPVPCGQWDWADANADGATGGPDMDSVYYYFDRPNGKRPV